MAHEGDRKGGEARLQPRPRQARLPAVPTASTFWRFEGDGGVGTTPKHL